MKALIKSLEFSLQQLQIKDPKVVDIFYLIGITLDGLHEIDIIGIFEMALESRESIMQAIKRLCEFSIIQLDSKTNKY